MMASARESQAMVASVDIETETDAGFEIQPRGLLKRLLPRTMFGRSLLIVVVPLVLLQAIAAWVFYDRHWAAVSWRLSAGVVGDIALLIEAMQLAGSATETARLLDRGASVTDLDFTLRRDGAAAQCLLPSRRVASPRSIARYRRRHRRRAA